MNVINNLNSEKFTLDGIPYLKNFMTSINFDKIRIINAYDSNFVLLDWTKYDQITLDGNTYANVEFLQEALLSILYSRDSLGSGNEGSGSLPPVESPDYANTAAMLANQANQTVDFLQFVIDASDDPQVQADADPEKNKRFYRYNGGTNNSLSDYTILSNSEAQEVTQNPAFNHFLVKEVSDTPIADTSTFNGVSLEYSGVNVTKFVCSPTYSNYLEKYRQLLASQEYDLYIFNTTKQKTLKAKVNAIDNTSSYYKIEVASGILEANISINDYLIFSVEAKGGGSTPAVTKTGTTLEFNEAAEYNYATPLTSETITLTSTNAVDKIEISGRFDRYVPTIEGLKYIKTGEFKSTHLNEAFFEFRTGEDVVLSIKNFPYLPAPQFSAIAGSGQNDFIIEAVPGADTYTLKFSLLPDDEDNATDVPGYNGTDLTPTHSGTTDGVEYYYYLRAQGRGFLESDVSEASATSQVAYEAMFASTSNTVDFSNIFSSLGTYDCKIYVDDVLESEITVWNQAETLIDLGDTLQHKITIEGICEGFSFNNGTEKDKIYELLKFGNLKHGVGTGLSGFYSNCSNLFINPSAGVPIWNSTSLFNAFINTPNVTNFEGLASSDVSIVTTIENWFRNSGITQDHNGMSFPALTKMKRAYYDSDSYNGEHDTWSVPVLEDISEAWRLCAIFNRNISSLITAATTNVAAVVFASPSYDQPFDAWDIRNVTTAGNICNSLGTSSLDATYQQMRAIADAHGVTSGLAWNFAGANYTIATTQADRDVLTNAPHSLVLSDAGGI